MDFKKEDKTPTYLKKEDITPTPEKAPTKPSGSKSLKEKFETIEHLKNTLRKASEEEVKAYAKLANVSYKGSKSETEAEIAKIWKNS